MEGFVDKYTVNIHQFACAMDSLKMKLGENKQLNGYFVWSTIPAIFKKQK
jgi:hypothetical protein